MSSRLPRIPVSQRPGNLPKKLRCLHFPVAFPEVFLRARPGFDCVLGNPPFDRLVEFTSGLTPMQALSVQTSIQRIVCADSPHARHDDQGRRDLFAALLTR
jgi:hypothetical protein